VLDRTTNLLALFVIAVAMIVLGNCLESAWRNTEPWEQGWATKAGRTPKYTASQLVTAMKGADAAGDYTAVEKLRTALEAGYEPSGDIQVRMTAGEILEALGNTGGVMLFLILPMSLNYIRHGSFRIWNRAPNKTMEPTR
jgi:hypothetical protein